MLRMIAARRGGNKRVAGSSVAARATMTFVLKKTDRTPPEILNRAELAAKMRERILRCAGLSAFCDLLRERVEASAMERHEQRRPC